MKYFATQIRPAKFEDGKFKFSKGRIYEVASGKAYDLYLEYCEAFGDTPHEGLTLWENGTIVHVHKYGVQVYGTTWDDKELFLRRLKGEIAKEIIK